MEVPIKIALIDGGINKTEKNRAHLQSNRTQQINSSTLQALQKDKRIEEDQNKYLQIKISPKAN